jgi:hypothetical protein
MFVKTADYLKQLQRDKQTLVDNLTEKGIEASSEDTFTQLTPKVSEIGGIQPPNTGFVPTEYTESGYFKGVFYGNYVPDYYFYTHNSTTSNNYFSKLTELSFNEDSLDGFNECCFSGRIGVEKYVLPPLKNRYTNYSNAGYGRCMFYNNSTVKEVIFSSEGQFKYMAVSDGTNRSETFSGCSSLESVTLPTFLDTKFSLRNIYAYMFTNCSSLKSIDLYEGITKIDSHGFYSCSKLVLTSLPESITSIKSNAFYGCKELVLTSLPKNLDTLETGAFYGCTNINIKEIPDNITAIYSLTFYNCSNITQISMNNVQKIGGSTTNNSPFGNSGLVAVWIGSAITSDGFSSYSFCSCNNLTKIFIDLPRETVEAMSGYEYAFQRNTSDEYKNKIICNDDEGFITKEEFDAIEWSTDEE